MTDVIKFKRDLLLLLNECNLNIKQRELVESALTEDDNEDKMNEAIAKCEELKETAFVLNRYYTQINACQN